MIIPSALSDFESESNLISSPFDFPSLLTLLLLLDVGGAWSAVSGSTSVQSPFDSRYPHARVPEGVIFRGVERGKIVRHIARYCGPITC
jgi:hypothetical protein